MRCLALCRSGDHATRVSVSAGMTMAQRLSSTRSNSVSSSAGAEPARAKVCARRIQNVATIEVSSERYSPAKGSIAKGCLAHKSCSTTQWIAVSRTAFIW